jgi:hypothetical protein
MFRAGYSFSIECSAIPFLTSSDFSKTFSVAFCAVTENDVTKNKHQHNLQNLIIKALVKQGLLKGIVIIKHDYCFFINRIQMPDEWFVSFNPRFIFL